MCGICGIFNKGSEPVSRDCVIKMRDVMERRGPDDAGLYINDHIGLGHRRLIIIDLSDAGRQPLCNEDKRIWIVVNGEIYNFIELREKLIKAGHIFRSKTDSEVIVHGYEEWGEDIFQKLNGAFSVAIWDSHKERLILARDRIGEKPLFYLDRNGSVIFASDIKSILTYAGNLEIDNAAIDCYLTHICVPQAHSIFKGIKKVKPAHYMVFDKNTTETVRYWQLSFRSNVNKKRRACLDDIDAILRSSVKKRLTSDVPLGAFLSGGVDSSMIVALMSELSSGKVKTFSVGFNNEQFNELPYAKKVAEKYGTDHQEIILEPDFLSNLPELVWQYGEPFADSSALPSYFISKVAREHIKVAIVGDGGDESFAGYSRTLRIFHYEKYGWLLSRLPINMAKEYRRIAEIGVRKYYKNLMGFNQYRTELYSSKFMSLLGEHSPDHIYEGFYDQADGDTETDRVLFIDINTILPDDYQVKMDIASMSNSLEVRAPFLDYKLIEYMASIPINHKMKYRQPKYLLKKLAERYIPRENIYRKKSGFAVPIGEWFKKGLNPDIYRIILSKKAINRNYFNYDYVRHVLDDHIKGAQDHSHRIWALLWLELWHRMFIDRDLYRTSSLQDIK